MGKLLKKDNRYASAKGMRHECEPPLSYWSFKPKYGFGSLWECDCGKVWEVKVSVIAEYVGKPNEPVPQWGRYKKDDFGLRSTITGKKKRNETNIS